MQVGTVSGDWPQILWWNASFYLAFDGPLVTGEVSAAAAVSKQNCKNNDGLQTGFLNNPLVCHWLDEQNL